MGTKAERRAARERVSAYHHAQLAELLTHVAAAIDRYRADEIDAHAVDETIHHYHRAGELWKWGCAPRDHRRDADGEQPGQRVPPPAPLPRVRDLGKEIEQVLAAGSRNRRRCHRRAGDPRGRRW
jgi:hypothetical protein